MLPKPSYLAHTLSIFILDRLKSTNGPGFLDSAYIMANTKLGALTDLQVQIHTFTIQSDDALKILKKILIKTHFMGSFSSYYLKFTIRRNCNYLTGSDKF